MKAPVKISGNKHFFIVCEACPDRISKRITGLLAEGWKLEGGVQVTCRGNTLFFTQALITYKEVQIGEIYGTTC